MSEKLFSSTAGMATLTPAGVEVFTALENLFLTWASHCNAQELRYPSLLRVEDLSTLDYFRNFPQLVMCACTLDVSVHDHYSQRQRNRPISAVPSDDLTNSEYCLPPAACYSVYLGLRGAALNTAQYFTTAASCFRNESHFRGLERLRGFTMREIVCIGSAEAVKTHLSAYRELLSIFSDLLDLPVTFVQATDPFFDKDSSSARAGRIYPTKEELVYRDQLAIGSVNYHRRFFGKRCTISVAGQTANTGCVAFGIERWLHALADRFGNHPQRISDALANANAGVLARMKAHSGVRAVGT